MPPLQLAAVPGGGTQRHRALRWCAWAGLLAVLVGTSGPGPGIAAGGEDYVAQPPIRYGGLTLDDGTLASAHVGLVRPPPGAHGQRWLLRQAASVHHGGRLLRTYQYSIPDTRSPAEPGAVLETWFQQTEYVDPATGQIVGGGTPGARPPVSESGDCTGW